MRRFLIHTGVLILLFLLMNVAFYFIFDFPRKNYIPSVTKVPNYLFGDSHAETTIIPDSLRSQWFNFSYGSDDFTDVLNKLTFLQGKGYLDSSSTVVLEVDIHLFSTYRMQANNNDLSGAFVNSPRAWVNYYAPVLGDKRVLSPDILLRGVGKPDVNAVVRLETLKDSLKFRERFDFQYGVNFSLESHYFDLVQDIINLCGQTNTRLVGVVYPVHPYYQQLIEGGTRHKELKDSVAFLFRNEEFLDLSDSISDSKYFRDQDHLNRIGSDRFLEILSAYFEGSKTQRLVTKPRPYRTGTFGRARSR